MAFIALMAINNIAIYGIYSSYGNFSTYSYYSAYSTYSIYPGFSNNTTVTIYSTQSQNFDFNLRRNHQINSYGRRDYI